MMEVKRIRRRKEKEIWRKIIKYIKHYKKY